MSQSKRLRQAAGTYAKERTDQTGATHETTRNWYSRWFLKSHPLAWKAGVVEIETFISKWAASGGAERANYGLFLTQLCDLLKVPQPDPTGPNIETNS